MNKKSAKPRQRNAAKGKKWSSLHRGVTVLYDPTDTYRVGARFDKNSFRCTTEMGNWPKGMQVEFFERGEKIIKTL